MDITVGIIRMRLGQRCRVESNFPVERDRPVRGFRIWGGERPEEHILYVCRETPSNVGEWKGKLLIGAGLSPGRECRGAFALSIEEPVEFDWLINALQDIFQEFFRWQREMERMFYGREDFTAILNKLEQSFGLVSILVDKNLRYLAMSDSFRLCNPWVGDRKTMSLEMINELMMDPSFREAIGHNKPFVYTDAENNDSSYCYNIKLDGTYKARLLIKSKKKEEVYGGLSLAGYVGEHLGEILARHSDEKIQETALYDFYNLLRDLLKGIPRSGEEISRCLQARGWLRTHMFQVYVFQFIGQESESVTRRYYQVEMERLYQECCILADGERLCCVRNLSMTDPKAWDIRQEVAVFLRENLCKAGVSQNFSDIAQLQQYRLEAERALQIGQKSNSTRWCYPFETLILPYICHQSVREISARQLYHPAVRTLLEYDRTEHTELVKTAYAYMKYRYNVTQTAQSLFIHRTTMLFRLQRIALLTGVDWDSWEDRLHLAVTFELMKREGEFADGF